MSCLLAAPFELEGEMAEENVERRLAAILAADVVGYSRLMEANEERTMAALKHHRREFFDPTMAKHGGRIFKVMGDGFLVEFGSVVSAARCAVEIQASMAARNESVPQDQRIIFRIGVNLGDVMVEGADLNGDGVNVAVRLEGLAEPGGICISAKVHAEVRDKLDTTFADMGEQILKNITQPVHTYRSVAQPAHAAASIARGKPSIAVLPFTNMSGDPEQEYFSDGLTEDIITELSRFKTLHVTARNSTFQYKGKSPNIQTVGRELGVQYAVEGSVRKSGNRVRVTAQLIDTATGGHLWGERFDRDLADIFAVQDEVVQIIAGMVPGHIDRSAVQSMVGKPQGNFTAYDCALRGRWALSQLNEGPELARSWFEKSLAADSCYAPAHAGLGMSYAYGLYVLGIAPEIALTKAKEHATRAILLDDRDPRVNAYVAFTYHVACEPLLALTISERAITLNPNDPFAHFVRACALTYGGDPLRALDWYAKSEQLEPYARNDQRLDALSDCHHMLGNYEKAIEIFESYTAFPAFLWLTAAASYARSGKIDKARAAVETYFRERPIGHEPLIMIDYQIKMCAREQDKEHWCTSYTMVGFVPSATDHVPLSTSIGSAP